ncbi:MAG: hypothetical protein HOP12_05575, partial [Candidatus Eisenbacteria bacterium]|nr:hypothetical protein [Candidatus Eisenbacteria bacterium]
MSESSPKNPSAELLRDQLKHLDRLRNAHARDHDFKGWRQNALTVIQRLWPDDQRRAERFRRISFTAPSPKAPAAVMRQYYDRGCIEAKGLLETWYRDVVTSGLTMSAPRKEESALPPGAQEDDFPVLDLDGGEAPSALSSVNDEYGFDDELASGLLPEGGGLSDLDAALDSMVRPRLPQREVPSEAPAPAPPSVRPAAQRPAPSRPEGRPTRPGTRRASQPKRALKDMLGFED